MGILTVAAAAKSQHGEPGWMSAQEWTWLQEQIKEGNRARADKESSEKRDDTGETPVNVAA